MVKIKNVRQKSGDFGQNIISEDNKKIKEQVINIQTLKIEKKKSFWNGFFIGIIPSLIASAIWFLVEHFIIK